MGTLPFLSHEAARKQQQQQPSSPTQRRMFDVLSKHFTLKLEDVPRHRWWTLLTPAFSHIQPYHLAANLVAFGTFSTMLLRYGIAPARYAALVLGAAVTGNLAFLFQAARSQRRQRFPNSLATQLRALGLSGVVMGLGAAVSLATPKAKVLLFGAIPTPIWLLMGVYTLYDSARLDDQASTVGHAAHLGGAAFGAAYYLLALRGPAALPFAWLARL
ncbi:hypothetical protein AYL99_00534 [Fonsecaea erecta]|uniref:Peptidase S54 rhomboid domain-containing protein n=1 Tax=Fonsecaea erecta TaxID=1367422 RepID=A0A178ZXZ0_9EURO|nr:hypothetical protein AYL99_00534 [Fonsecaea erecta]OAP64562.1 hypothetical protein AYL99_00534 [Fonsecaea erecta]